MAPESLDSNMTIQDPTPSRRKFYCTEKEWREHSGLFDQSDFPSNEIQVHLRNATEKVKKDGFHMVRWEFVTSDSEGRYFLARRFLANRYGRDTDVITIHHGQVTKYDIEVYESEAHSTAASNIMFGGARRADLIYGIPYEAITEIDPVNGYFKLAPGYPTDVNRRIYATYWIVGKPLEEIGYELKMACVEMTTIYALKRLKTKRLKKATTSYSLGKQSITRDEQAFDEMIKEHQKEYERWINWFRPFIGRRAKIGRMETSYSRRYINRW